MPSESTRWESGCVFWWNYSNDTSDRVEIRATSGDDGQYGGRNLPYAIARAATAAGHGNAPWSPLDLLLEAIGQLDDGDELAKRAGERGVEAWNAIKAWRERQQADMIEDSVAPHARA